jgi:hypothetical protein
MLPGFLLFAVLALTVYGPLVIKVRASFFAAEAGHLRMLHHLTAMLADLRELSGRG